MNSLRRLATDFAISGSSSGSGANSGGSVYISARDASLVLRAGSTSESSVATIISPASPAGS